MANLGRHGRNVLWLLLVQVVGKVFGFLYFAYLFDKLTMEQNEWYALFVSLLPVLIVLNTLGFHDVVNREVAKNNQRVHGLMASAVVAELLLFLPIFAAVAGWALLRPMAEPLRHVLLVLPPVAFVASLLEIHNAVFAAHERFKYPSMVNIGARLATVCGGLLLLFLGYRVRTLAAWLGAVQMAQLALFYVLIQKYCGGYRFRPSLADMRFLARQGVLMAAGRFGEQAYYRMDLPALRMLGAPGLSTRYALGPRFFNLMCTAPDLMESVFYPVVSRRSKEGRDAVVFAVERFFKAAMLIAAPMVAGMTVLGAEIVRTVAGAEYVSGAPVAVVFAWLVGLAMVDRVVVVYLRATAMQRTLVRVYGAAFLLKLGVCVAVLGTWGIRGLLVTNIALSALMSCVMLAVLARQGEGLPLRRFSRVFWRPALAALAMAAVLWPLRDGAIWWTIPAGAAVYGTAALALGVFDAFDRRLVRSALGLEG